MYAQLKLDYSAAEMVIDFFRNPDENKIVEIAQHPAYELVFEHSRRFSSTPLDSHMLTSALKGKSNAFNFSKIDERLPELTEIIGYLKKNEQKMRDEFAPLSLFYLPEDYRPEATVYFVIGGYNGVVLGDGVAMNIDWAQFRGEPREILFYLPHELFHIGFSHYQQVPDIFSVHTEGELKKLVMSFTMNEGLATLVPYRKRLSLDATADDDYSVLTDDCSLRKMVKQFKAMMAMFHEKSGNNSVTDEFLGTILGQCSGDRLFYTVGCYMGLCIENKYGRGKIIELIRKTPEDFFMVFRDAERE